MERESMLMYRSTREMLQDLKREDKEQYLFALEIYMNYAFDGIEPDLSDEPLVLKLFWKAAKPLIDANNRNYVNGCKGGAPTGNSNAKKQPKTTQKQPRVNSKTTQKQGNDNVNDNDNVNVHEHVNEHANDNDNVNDNDNDNKKINKIICPYVDEEGYITDWDKFQEWKSKHPDWRAEDEDV